MVKVLASVLFCFFFFVGRFSWLNQIGLKGKVKVILQIDVIKLL